MVFGKSKEDKSQDAQLKNVWKWIQHLSKNQEILVKNSNAFIEKNKTQATLNKQLTATINQLVEKDKLHDQKDAEHDALIQNLKSLGKALETATTEG